MHEVDERKRKIEKEEREKALDSSAHEEVPRVTKLKYSAQLIFCKR